MKDLNKLKDKILLDVEEYIDLKSKKTWNPGKDYVHYAGPYFNSAEYKAAISTILDGWLVLDKKGIQFEKQFATELGKKYGIFVNSGSSANLLMVAILQDIFPPNTRIITPISGFPTTINPIIQLGFKPIFIDVELDTLNIDLNALEKRLILEQTLPEYKKSKAIMLAHVLGNPTDMNRLIYLCKKYNLMFLEDCCDALGSTYDNKKLGSFGKMSTCSFYPAHHMTTGEGGFVATDCEVTYKKLKQLRDWGRGCFCATKEEAISKEGACKNRFGKWLKNREGLIVDHKFVFESIGYNLKPIEVQAAIALEQIKKLDEMKKIRKENYRKLYNIFNVIKEYLILPEPTEKSDPNWFAFPITVRENKYFTRQTLIDYFEKYKIQTRPYFSGNILEHPAYSKFRLYETFPNADTILASTFFIGTSPVITDEQIEYISKIFSCFLTEYVW